MATEIDNKYAATIKSYPAIGQPTMPNKPVLMASDAIGIIRAALFTGFRKQAHS